MVGLIIYFGVVALLLVGSIWKPAFSLGAILCMFALEQWGAAKIGVIATHSSLSNYVSFAIVAFGLSIKVYRGHRLRILNGPIHILVALLFAYSAATVLWTPALAVAIEEWRAQLPYVLLTVVVVPLLVQNADDASDGLSGTLAAGAILTLCLTFLVDWGYRSIVSDIGAGTAIRLPLAIAQLGAYMFVLAVMFMRWRGLSWLLAIGLLAVSVLLVIKTGSRGQLIAMVATSLLLAPMSRGKSLLHSYMPVLIFAGLSMAALWYAAPGLLSPMEDDRFAASRAVEDYEGRLDSARALFDAYLSSGILGLLFGLGSSASFSPEVVGFYPHIVPIEILCELGIVGASLFLGVLGLTIRSVLRYMRTLAVVDSDGGGRRVVASLAALFICELLLSMKEGSLLRDPNLLLFPILIEGIVSSAAATYGRWRHTVGIADVEAPARSKGV